MVELTIVVSVRRVDLADADCGIAQSLGVLTDWWTFLLIRDIAGGVTRFDGLQRGLGMSRRALTERLAALVEHGVLYRRRYTDRPPRFDYLLTAKGEGLLPVLIALQDWGSRHVLGDGRLTGAGTEAEIRRVHGLLGRVVPAATGLLAGAPAPTRPAAGGGHDTAHDAGHDTAHDAGHDIAHDAGHDTAHDGGPALAQAAGAEAGRWTVLYCFPGAFAPGTQGHPPGWTDIP